VPIAASTTTKMTTACINRTGDSVLEWSLEEKPALAFVAQRVS
jgi:hypothetical protein